jgi:hypothetical protein
MEQQRSERKPRTKFVSFAIPGELGEDLEELKYACQDSGIKITERQLIGRNGIVLAALARLSAMPEDEQFKFVSEGIDRLKTLGIQPSEN